MHDRRDYVRATHVYVFFPPRPRRRGDEEAPGEVRADVFRIHSVQQRRVFFVHVIGLDLKTNGLGF